MGARPADHALLGPLRLISGQIPFVLTLFLVLLVNLPVSFTGHILPSPALALASLYFWVLVRPDLMPPLAVLIIGFLEDLLSGGPPGLWVSGYLAAYLLSDRQRDTLAGLNGVGAILGFGGAMLTAAGTAYAVLLFVYWRAAPVGPLLLECAATVISYPLIALAMGWVLRHAVGPLRRHE